MSRPVNNLALTYSEIRFKTFIKESSESNVKVEEKSKFELNFNGNEAKQAYEEILSLESQRKSLPRQCNTISKNSQDGSKTSTKSLKKSADSININILFKSVESGDTNFVYEHLNFENVNISDQFGWTPLMCAACAGHMEIVYYLLNLGANPKAMDKSGMTATDLALRKNNHHIVKILEQHKNTNFRVSNENKNLKKKDQKGFYCDLCQISFLESTRNEHESSTLHVFNSKPKVKNAFYLIPRHNRGYQMLLNTGWKEEGGLGPDGEGKKYPVKTVLKRDRKGLGQPDKSVARVTHFKPEDTAAIKFLNKHRHKPFKRKDREKQLSREAAKNVALRRALS